MRLGLNGRFLAARPTGVQRFAREVAARLPELADDVTLFLPRGAAAPGAARAGVRVSHGRLAGHAWEQLELPRRAREARCDVVLHPANTAPLAGGPHVVVIHDALALTRPEWFGRAFRTWYRHVQRRAARSAAALVTVSEWARGDVAAALGIDADRIAVVRQGVEPFDRPADEAAARRLRERLGVPSRYLLAVGDGDPRKNIDFLHRVRERWRATRGEPPALVVVGAPSPRVHSRTGHGAASHGAAAPSVSATHTVSTATAAAPAPVGATGEGRPDGVGDADGMAGAGGAGGASDAGVVRLGRVDDGTLRALYTGAAAFCFPSLAEGFGRPPLEAMACGAPVVVAPYGPAREVLGAAARIVPLEPAAWVSAIEALLEPGAAREAAREAGRRHAAAFRWAAAAERVLEVCRAVAAGGRR